MLMVEAMETAATRGGVTGAPSREGFYPQKDWVPAGFQGVCMPSTFTATDHRGTHDACDLYRIEGCGRDRRAGPRLIKQPAPSRSS